MVVQGFHGADAGADKAAPVATLESVQLRIGNAAFQNRFVLKTSRHSDGVVARKVFHGGGSVPGTSEGFLAY